MTVPVEVDPPTTVDGLNRSDVTVGGGGITVRVATSVLPLYDARRSTAVVAATTDVVTANDAETSPAPMVTLAGTLADAGFVLASVTTAPPAGAGPLSVAVPVADWPPATVDGLTPSELSDTTGSAPGCQPSWTTSKSLAVRAPNAGLRMSLSQRVSKVPPMYMSEPLSATMSP